MIKKILLILLLTLILISCGKKSEPIYIDPRDCVEYKDSEKKEVCLEYDNSQEKSKI
jgi:hypothetical protein